MTIEKSEFNNRGVQPVLANDEGLRPVRTQPSFPRYLVELWGRRHFIVAEARSKALRTGRGTFLGRAWIVFDPLFQVAVYAVIFGVVLRVSRGIDNFVGFLVLGVIFFGFMSSGFAQGSGLIQTSRNLITSFSFPRAALAASATVRSFIDNVVPALVAIVLALIFQLDKTPTWALLLVVPLYFLLHLFVFGLTLAVARVTAFIPDTKPLVTLTQRALFFVSGVFFSLNRFDSHPSLQQIMKNNPFYQFLTAVRMCVLEGQAPPLTLWVALIGWSFGTAFFGLFFFWGAESRYSNVK